MYCPHCGKEIPDEAVFCAFCGNNVKEVKGKQVWKPNINNLISLLVGAIILCALFLFSRKGNASVEIIDMRDVSSEIAEELDSTVTQNTTSSPIDTATDIKTSSPIIEESLIEAPFPTVTLVPTETPAPTTTLTPTEAPSPTPTQSPTQEPMAIITVIGGIQAPASDFMFPYSSEQVLTQEQLNTMISSDREEMHSASQLAINEMFARYGYTFGTSTETAREAKAYFESLDWYIIAQNYCSATEWETVRTEYMNSVERENINRINSWQQEHGVYY